jgi:large subunit ribosomal protein L25
MEQVTLEAEPRTTGRHANRELRNDQRVPCVVYGNGREAMAVSVDRKLLGQALHRASGRTIELNLPGQGQLHVLTREVQRDSIKHRVLHVDFLAVSMTEKVRLSVPVVPDGVAPALDGVELVLVRGLDTVEVECLPGDIPANLVIDVTSLVSVHDEVLVKDLQVPAGVVVLTDPTQVLFSVTPSRAAVAEEAEEPEETSADEVEVIKRKREEEEEE